MLSGLQVSTKPVSSSTRGSASTITPHRIRRSACVRPFRKLYIEVALNEGARQADLLTIKIILRFQCCYGGEGDRRTHILTN